MSPWAQHVTRGLRFYEMSLVSRDRLLDPRCVMICDKHWELMKNKEVMDSYNRRKQCEPDMSVLPKRRV
jgi:hypothetical protein